MSILESLSIYDLRAADWRNGALVYQVFVDRFAPPADLEAKRGLYAAPAPPRLFSGYAVQAGVFADAQRAEELRAKLTLNGIPSTMEARVQVGPFKTREEAEAAREKMKALGIDGILLPPKGGKR